MCLEMNRGIFVTENSIKLGMLSTYIIYSSLDFLTDSFWGFSAEVYEPNFPSMLWTAQSADMLHPQHSLLLWHPREWRVCLLSFLE